MNAAQQWYVSVKVELEKLGCIQSEHDLALFLFYKGNQL